MPSDYAEDRARKLLLTKDEIKSITGALHEKGRFLVPLQAYLKRGFIKLELGLGEMRKKSDKREVLKSGPIPERCALYSLIQAFLAKRAFLYYYKYNMSLS